MTATRTYWEERLSSDFSLRSVGDRRLGLTYNKWLYRGRRRALDRAIGSLKVDLTGKRVLDIGSGTGFYIDYWLSKGATEVTGLDITEVSVRNLERRYPGLQFVCADIASESLSALGKFDIISAFDVLFHIANDEGFLRAFQNISDCCNEGAYVFVSDHFPPEDAPLTSQESHRSRAHYGGVFATVGVKEIYASPVFYLMGSPLPGERHPLLRALWWFTFRALRASRRLGVNSLFGNLIGMPMYVVDGILTRTSRWGPNMKLMTLKRVSP